MRLIYLYTTLNWYRLELFKSITKYIDIKIYILNGYSVGYQGIEYQPNCEGLDITYLSKENSKFNKLCNILNQEKFDGIVVPSMNDMSFLILTTKLSYYYSKKNKTVMYFWEYWPMEKGKYGLKKWIKQKIRHIFTRLNKKSIDYFLTPSINTYSFYQRLNIPSNKIIRCFNVSEIGLFVDIDIKENLGIGINDKIVLFFGRLEEYKGVNELIEAFDELKNINWHLVICGPGEEKINKKHLNNNIHVLGSIPIQKRGAYYKSCDVFVLPNTYNGKIEPWGLTVNEAMSFGKPIIASNATGSAIDLVFPGVNGYICDSDNLKNDLVFYMDRLLSDANLMKYMGENSKKIIYGYTFDNMAKAFEAALTKRLIRKE